MEDRNDATALQSEFPKKGQTAHGSESAYTVEARCTFQQPQVIAGVLLGQNWHRLTFDKAMGHGVPDGPAWFSEGRMFGFLSYPSAQALRWWFVANACVLLQDNGLETRLVKHEIKYSREESAAAEQGRSGFREHRGWEPPPPEAA